MAGSWAQDNFDERRGVVVVRHPDELTRRNFEAFQARLEDHIEGGRAKIALDMSETRFLTSDWFGLFVQSLRRAWHAGGDIRPFAVCGLVRRVFDLGLRDRVRVFDTEEEAVASFDEPGR